MVTVAVISNFSVITQLVALMTICDSWYVRSQQSRCCESNLAISPEFQGRGIGREIINVEMSIEVELGYTSTINDYSASNRRMRHLLRCMHGRQIVVVGCLPRSLYTAGVGWDDQIIIFQNFPDTRPFTEIAEYSRMRRVSTSKI